jgi:hypothetical protein
MIGSELNPKTMSRDKALELSTPEKLLYFKNAVTTHPHIKDTLSSLEILSMQNSGTQIIFLIGPTGVGKSLVVDRFKESVIKENWDLIVNDPSFIPIISIVAPSSGEQVFSWRSFYSRLGVELNESLMDQKTKSAWEPNRRKTINVNTASTIAGMRDAVENALAFRRTSIIIVDEAIPLMRDRKSTMIDKDKIDAALLKKMDTLKSLANINGLTLIFVGSYDLYEMMTLSGQVTRRSFCIHFERYCSLQLKKENKGLEAFRNSLDKLQIALPIKGLPDLKLYVDDIMTSCFGCVGTLKDTLQRTLSISLKKYNGVWDFRCLKSAYMSKDQLDTIMTETIKGEERIKYASFMP